MARIRETLALCMHGMEVSPHAKIVPPALHMHGMECFTGNQHNSRQSTVATKCFGRWGQELHVYW